MKKILKTVILLALAAMMCLGATVSSFADGETGDHPTVITPINTITIDKTVVRGEWLSNPAATFAFTFKAQWTAFNDALTYADPTKTTISVSKDSTATESITLNINHFVFNRKDVYRFDINEVYVQPVDDSVTIVPGYTYDKATKYLWLYVDGNPAYDSVMNPSVPKYICYSAIVTDVDTVPTPDETTGAVNGKIGGSGTLNGIPFTNLYTKKNPDVPENPDDPVDPAGDLFDLTVSKVVTGNQGDKTKEFNFKVSLSGLKSDRFVKITKDGSLVCTLDPSANISLDEEIFTYIPLADGQSLTVHGLIKGEKYSIIESNGAEYTTVATGADSFTATDAKASGEIKDADVNIIYTNTKDGVIPTGIFLNYKPYWIIGGCALLLVILVAKKRKDRVNEL